MAHVNAPLIAVWIPYPVLMMQHAVEIAAANWIIAMQAETTARRFSMGVATGV